MLLKRTITQTNFCITSWLGLQNFLMEFYQVHEKSNFFNLFEKAICFWGKNLSTEDFWHEIQRLSSDLGCLLL